MAKGGLFWCVCRYEIDDDGNCTCDFAGARLISHIPPDPAVKTPSHRETWSILDDRDRDKPWNYYPRGRVEIRGGKALVFLNPFLFSCSELQNMLRSTFDIEGAMPIVFKADNSHHYRCAANDDALM